MAKEWAEWFYQSRSWKECRKAFLESKHSICDRCGEPADIVHHKEYLTPKNINDPRLTLSWNNLEALCQDCHNKEHHGSNGLREGFYFDEEGNLKHE